MNQEYSIDDMLMSLEKYFKRKKYKTRKYYHEVAPARVPLLCKKSNDIIIVELTTNRTISKNDWFHEMDIAGIKIEAASSICFYRYYFLNAKIYLAYPDYVDENEVFEEFKKACKEKGIGLLRVSKNSVEEISGSEMLYDEICNELDITADKKKRLEYYLRNYLHYFVYYPAPIYKRRAITGRMEGNMSFVLIDKLEELNNISYKDILRKLSLGYRQETRSDYEIALGTSKKLWSEVCGVEYPEIQRQLEDILLRNSEYRDHFLHQFMVFLLGAYIIDKLYKEDKEYIKQFNSRYNCKIEKMWLLASTYHDFNYSIERYNIWSKEFFGHALSILGDNDLSSLKLDAAFIRENFLLKTSKICEALDLKMDHIVMNFFYEQTISKRNHGLLSALSLLKLFENNRRSCKIKQSALVQTAVAIALHDENIWSAFSGREEDEEWNCNFAKKVFLQNLEFKKYPLGFLLIFCDTVQEWGRVGKNYKVALSRLENITVNSTGVFINISVQEDSYYKEKQAEIERVKKFLNDDRFKIKLDSRDGGVTATTDMKGR